MFYHMNLRANEEYEHNGIVFELLVYQAQEDNHLRGYVSSGGFSDLIIETSSITASDMQETSDVDPVQYLIEQMKKEIGSGKINVDR